MKLKNLLKESQNLDYRRMNIGEEENEKGMTNEEKRAFVEAVAAYRQLGEMISHKGNLAEIHESIKKIVENASTLTIKETGDWFDRVTVQRHMKSMNESYKVFSNSIKEVVTLQQRMESAYDEIGEVLGKYYEIKEGNAFSGALNNARNKGQSSFEVDGKRYPVEPADGESGEGQDGPMEERVKLTKEEEVRKTEDGKLYKVSDAQLEDEEVEADHKEKRREFHNEPSFEKNESVNEVKYPIAVAEFNKELIKHPMVKKAAQHYKKTPADIVKVLQQRLYTKGDRSGNTKEVYIDFKDTDSGIVIKHKMKFNESKSMKLTSLLKGK